MQERQPRATIDFEARGLVQLSDVGTWVYTRHPDTLALCMAYRLPHWERGRTEVWHPAFPSAGLEASPPPEELFEWVARGGLVEAHNAQMERWMWMNNLRPRRGWPEPPPVEQWRCSAAKAAAHSMPRNLEELAIALGLLNQKDSEGKRLMNRMRKPRKLLKREEKELRAAGVDPASRLWWHESREDLLRLFEYCRRDVLAEEEASEALPDLVPREEQMFRMDMRVNERGFQLDRPAVEVAMRHLERASAEMNGRLAVATGGRVLRATQREKMRAWFAENGLELEDTQGTTLDEAMERDDLPPHVAVALQLVRDLNRSSTAKYAAMVDWADPDDWKVRGGMLYHGAGTGRWSGKGVQPHNFPRGSFKNMELAWEVLKGEDAEWWADLLYDGLYGLLSHALRGAIVASPGQVLYVADYAAIEARVLMWLAGVEAALEVFRRREDIYLDMASDIYKRRVLKEESDKRQMGKQSILGLGYGMGPKKFVDTVAKYGIEISLEFAQVVVEAYRTKYHQVRAMWYAQEDAAIEAVRTGRTVACGRVHWRVVGRFLYCRLPSGRRLAYYAPAVGMARTPWGSEKPTLTFMGVDPYTRKWRRQKTYGGMLVENITQAVARDLMAEAMARCEERGTVYRPILSVHDELIAEAPEGTGDVREFEALMAENPPWAEGCPVEAEGWRGGRYRK